MMWTRRMSMSRGRINQKVGSLVEKFKSVLYKSYMVCAKLRESVGAGFRFVSMIWFGSPPGHSE